MRIAFRVDASPEMGAGHVMRCLTLAKSLLRLSCEVVFLCRSIPPELKKKLTASGIVVLPLAADGRGQRGAHPHSHWLDMSEMEDAEECLRSLHPHHADWIVVDHYALGREWETCFRKNGTRVLVIDDLADRPHSCDIISDSSLDDNLEETYANLIGGDTVRLFGCRYALLRAEFAIARSSPREIPDHARSILVCFGAYDHLNYSSKVLQALKEAEYAYDVTVLLGRSSPHLAEVQLRVAAQDRWKLIIDCDDVAAVMIKSDMAIGAGGQMTYERACLGLPALTVQVAENQVNQLVAADQAKLAKLLSPQQFEGDELGPIIEALAADRVLRAQMSAAGSKLIDGKGASRICAALLQNSELTVRRAELRDMEMIYEWRNDARTVSVSGNQKTIPLNDHEGWFRRKIASTDTVMLVCETGQVPCGVIRFDLIGKRATVSVFAAPPFIGLGLGRKMLTLAEAYLRANSGTLETLEATVLTGHKASEKLFASMGYKKLEMTWIKRLAS